RIMEIAVADTGPGIAKERQTAIFNAFVQADNSVSRRCGGTGLGLAISRRLALLMGGAIELESDEDEGTTMTLSLPLDEAFATAAGAVAPAVRDLGAALDAVEPIGGPASILLVEDTDINRELITDMLQGLGHRVDVAENGSAALKMARKLKDDPQRWDMILMDVHMAVMDGLTATRAIRALGGRARTIPIVALTANAFPAEIQECVEAGMDDHIAKPSGIPELRQAIDHWCKDARSAAPEKGDCAIPKASLGDRFDARMRKSRARLTEIGSALASAGEDKAAQLLEEAAEIAHMLAGTAGMFGKAWLGTVAQQSETALKRILKRPRPNAKAVVPIDQLVAALETSTQQPQPDSTAAKVANA
ncbi:MAG: hypothetical protein QOF34_367, partial [Sphingomonadales bacterium]|nr:hypothetical protein [Sphingomonadales bacterium]